MSDEKGPPLLRLFSGETEWEIEQKVRAWLLEKNNAASVHFVRKDEGPDALFRLGTRLLEDDYRSTVKSYAEDVVQEIVDGDIDDRDKLDTYLHETIDGCQDVIYTYRAQAVCLCSNNDGQGVEEGLIPTEAFKEGIPWAQLAFCALRADVQEELDSMGIKGCPEETEDPLEELVEFDDHTEEGKEEDVIRATLKHDGFELVGDGDDRESALDALRADYRRKRQERSDEREKAREAESRRAASEPVPSE